MRDDLFYSKLTYTDLFEMFKQVYCANTGEEQYPEGFPRPRGRAEAVAWIEAEEEQ